MAFQKSRISGRAAVLIGALALTVAVPAPTAWADPPPWAPAHGYRNKGKGKGHDRVVVAQPAYAVPFGIDLGKCNKQEIGMVLGGATGGVLGSTVGKGDGKTVAVIGGTLIGILVGGAIGKAMDQQDHQCTGQILEHAQDNQRIIWNGPQGAEYSMRPGKTWQAQPGIYCRDYQATATIGGKAQQIFGKACRNPDGSWQFSS